MENKPTLKEVKEYFKNAKKVKSLGGSFFEIKDLSLISYSHFDKSFYYNQGTYEVFDGKRYAEIISYKDENRLKYIDTGLRIANIQLDKEILEKVVKIVDLVDEKGGNYNVEDILKL